MINKNLFQFNIKKDKSYFLIYGLLLFAVFPLPILLRKINGTNIYFDHNVDVNAHLTFLVITSIFLVLITPFLVFNYLFSKKSVDVYHAIPVKRKELFVTQYVTSFLLVFLPFTLNYFLGHTFFITLYKTNITNLVQNYLIIILFLLIIQSLSTFIILNTGTLLDSLIHTFLFLLYPFFIFLTLNAFSDRFLFGLNGIPIESLKTSSPLYAVFYALGRETLPVKLLIYWITVFLVFFIFQRRMYFNRKSERSEEPFTNDWYFPISVNIFSGFMFILINIIYNSMSHFDYRTISRFLSLDAMLISVTLTFVGYAVLNLFRYRSAKFLLKTLRDYLLIILISSSLAITLIGTQNFNRVWKLPKINQISSIEFNVNDLYWVHPILNPNENTFNTVKVENKDFIEKFIKFHNSINNKILKQKDFYKKGDSSGLIKNELLKDEIDITNFSFTYNLKNGRKIHRNLRIPAGMFVENFIPLTSYGYHEILYPVLNDKNSIINPKLYNSFMNQSIEMDETLMTQVTLAYQKDLKNIDLERLLFEKSYLKYIIVEPSLDLESQLYLFIDTRFENTVELLDKFFLQPKDDHNTTYIFPHSLESANNNGPIHLYQTYEEGVLMDLDNINKQILGSHVSKYSYEYLGVNEYIFLPVE